MLKIKPPKTNSDIRRIAKLIDKRLFEIADLIDSVRDSEHLLASKIYTTWCRESIGTCPDVILIANDILDRKKKNDEYKRNTSTIKRVGKRKSQNFTPASYGWL